MKLIAETLGVARSNLVERANGKRPKRGPQIRAGDAELTPDIRRLVDSRPSYGYRRIAALLKRERRSAGHDPVNAKRVYRLMKKSGLLLARWWRPLRLPGRQAWARQSGSRAPSSSLAR
nr:IS3 family transposase [Bradyrhizobium sp. 6(2017)]